MIQSCLTHRNRPLLHYMHAEHEVTTVTLTNTEPDTHQDICLTTLQTSNVDKSIICSIENELTILITNHVSRLSSKEIWIFASPSLSNMRVLLLLFVLYNSYLDILAFLTVCQTKPSILRCHLRLWEIVIGIFTICWHFIDKRVK